ncbi:CapA family protein [Sphingopyxis sp. CCNWLW253]|uniref:CapA family protein n=1 Tax=unclassified Sphingopyxis TaxID=2614943 RepID=UPI0030131778
MTSPDTRMRSKMARMRQPRLCRMLAAGALVAGLAFPSVLIPRTSAQTIATFKPNPADQIPAKRKAGTIADGFTLAAVGDLVGPEIPVMGLEDPEFAKLVDILRNASVAVANAETPVFDLRTPGIYPEGGTSQPSKPPVIAKEYAQMGFDVLSMAFNHAGDWSPPALEQMQHLLNEAGIETMGYGITRAFAQAPAYVNTRFGRVSFVGVTTTLNHAGGMASDGVGFTRSRAGVNALRLNKDKSYNEYDHYNQLRALRFAKDVSDLAVLYVHSHEEPRLFTKFYRDAIDAGADIVIASHTEPERRGIEIYKGFPIFYGINPFFYSMYELSTPNLERYEQLDVDPRASIPRDIIDHQFARYRAHEMFGSVIAVIHTRGGRPSEIRLIPIELREAAKDYRNGHPRPANAEQGREILDGIAKASAVYGTKIRIEDNVGIISIPAT